MNYWMLNLIFLTVIAVLLLVSVLTKRSPGLKALSLTLLVLLAMTAVFDNIMIAIGLVGYNAELTNPARIGVAPLEDFAYAIAAALGLPAVWMLTAKRKQKAHD